MFEEIFENVRQKSPLVHNITNYVTVNDCANMLLACGGSPIMADELEDAVEITAIFGAEDIEKTCRELQALAEKMVCL